ncbi:MAG: TRAP transporter substrate-binding protein [Alphaproteobacteria bacterium]|nr:TRAP transporter substrate-binding protein [Alphaproteobacteria bacterium]
MTSQQPSVSRRTALGAIAATMLTTPAAAQQVTLRTGHTNAVGEVQDEGLRHLDKELRGKTGGNLGLQIFPNGQLGAELPLVEGLLIGSVDLVVVSHAAFANFVKEFQILDMPFLFRDYAHVDRAARGPMMAELQAAAQRRNLRVLGLYSSGIRHIMTRAPVRSMDDLKGRKIRTIQNPVHVAAFQAFGANATALPYNELYGALQTGVVDGAEAAYTNYVGQKFYEVSPNWATVAWLSLTAPVVMAERRFQALSKEHQDALSGLAAESAVWQRKLVVDTEDKLVEEVKRRGIAITNPDPAPFRNAAKAVYDRFLTTDGDKKLLQIVQQTP